MDSHIRCIGVHGHKEWILKAAAFQQQYYMEKKSWLSFTGKREILEEEIKALFVDHTFTNNVEKLMDVIYKQVYGFSKFRLQILEPKNKNNKLVLFLVRHNGNQSLIDQEGYVYLRLLDVSFQKQFHYHPEIILKVHDFEGLCLELAIRLHGEEYDITRLGLMIYVKLGLHSQFAGNSLINIGKKGDYCIHFPVVRIARHGNESVCKRSIFYVDHIGRVYWDWEDFLRKNIYPEWIMCYPRNGVYQANLEGDVLLDVKWSPAKGNVMNALDVIGPCIALGSLALGGGVLAATGVAIASGCSLVVGGSQLVDRWKHGQSITNHEAAGGWLNFVGGLAGVASGPLKLAQGLKTGGKMAKGIQVATKISNAAPSITAGGKTIGGIEKVIAIQRCFRGVKYTLHDVHAVFSYVKVKCIELKNFVIEISFKVKEFFLKLWCTYFPLVEHCEVANGISSVMSASKNLETNVGDFKDENDFYSIANLIFEIKALKLKSMEKEYQEHKKRAQESLGSGFDESLFDKEWGINVGDDRKKKFLEKVNSEISEGEVIECHEKYTNEISILNHGFDVVKFSTDKAAIRSYLIFHCVNRDVTPKEFFSMITNIGTEVSNFVKIDECGRTKSTTYYDDKIPLVVKISDINGKPFVDFARVEEYIDESKN
ncbi:uncharacterized protein LOC124167825 [Ischnura elegans]|uniref:uncharacterized protein LOC124167807 n=1 Tax=Ischnura elegans TaxID=197161 RepID=UPI001ED8B2AD|nr:uncharacterized protein LOC124167807 [Ischnura elegans]XP_046401801.1 uncharacterized protein LOC124167811 [Ischnura elegans]XP_046401820.1 uncharacterized protein LOC124167825 [Ischnura elegans]